MHRERRQHSELLNLQNFDSYEEIESRKMI